MRANLNVKEAVIAGKVFGNIRASSRIELQSGSHLEGDIVRIYRLLVLEWVNYMRYLQSNYGYLFSLAMRMNPFDPEASPVVRDP